MAATLRSLRTGLPSARRPLTTPERTNHLPVSAARLPIGAETEQGPVDSPGMLSTSLRTLIDALPDGVVIAATSGALLYCNVAAQRLVGFGPGGVGGADWMEQAGCYLPDGVTRYPHEQLPISQALRGLTCENVEVFLRNDARPHGTWISVSASPCYDPEGSVVGGIAVFRDITEIKRSVDLLSRLSTAVETTSDSVVMTDARGTIVFVNPAFERTTGYTRQEALGATPRILKSSRHDAQYYEVMWKTIRSGKVFRDVLVNRRRDGTEYYAEQTITPVAGPDGSPSNYVSLMRDITERRRVVQQETELSLARDVQERLYPRTSTHIRGYDASGVMHPAEKQMVSGDYFDIFPMADGSTGIALGDVCGHGISAALIMAQTRAYVRSFASTDPDVNRIIFKVNEALVADLAAENFVTLFVARFDASSSQFTYANGGHLSGYVLDATGRVRESLPSSGLALGFFAGREYEPRSPVPLGHGEMLLLFTDGIVESESLEGEEFGTARAIAVAAAHCHLPAASLAETLYENARNFAGDAPQLDDMTVFVCKAE